MGITPGLQMLPFVLALVLLAGCPAPDTDGDVDTAADDTCDTIPARAASLRESYQACTPEVGCEVVTFHEGVVGPNTCLAGFQCSDAFPTGADLAPLAEAAAALEAEFESAECTDCRDDVACEDPTVLRAECNESTGLCQIVSP